MLNHSCCLSRVKSPFIQCKLFSLGMLFDITSNELILAYVWCVLGRGYVAPEYALLGQLTEKADVFSYGIVLLELVSGRFNIRTDIRGEQAYLLEWVRLSILLPLLSFCQFSG